MQAVKQRRANGTEKDLSQAGHEVAFSSLTLELFKALSYLSLSWSSEASFCDPFLRTHSWFSKVLTKEPYPTQGCWI